MEGEREVYRTVAKRILQTTRLVLREIEVSAVESLFELNSDWDVMKYTEDISFESLLQTKAFIKIS